MEIEFIGQLIDSMNEAVLRLEKSVEEKRLEDANKLKIFILDVHSRISELLEVKDA